MAAAAAELRLLGEKMSPYCIRVEHAMAVKGVTGYEYVEEDLENKSELLLASNPVHAKVPVLIHNSKPLCESLIIVQYVDEVWAGAGPSLLPSDPYERSRARFWAAYIDDKFFRSYEPFFMSRTKEEMVEKFKNVIPQVETLEEGLKECSKGKPFFGGDRIGFVDVALGGYLRFFKALDEVAGTDLFDAARFPRLAAWAERYEAVDAIRRASPAVADVVEFYKKMQAAGPPH
uniref:Glutathione S-transferase n=1 Tax=Leersia perrieri TaxID=77586 RepID=A0A0D9V4E3_9ORYZ